MTPYIETLIARHTRLLQLAQDIGELPYNEFVILGEHDGPVLRVSRAWMLVQQCADATALDIAAAMEAAS